MPTLEKLLRAKRADLIDGFPTLAVLASAKTLNPLARLNALLEPERILVEQVEGLPSDLMIINPFMLKRGVIASSYDKQDDLIKLMIDESFFGPSEHTIIVRALTFQSICVHQLVHRARNHKNCCKVFYRPLAESLNDDQELEAMGAGLAHDVRCKGIMSVTGEEALQQLSPRLANIMANSRSFEPGSIPKLHKYVKKFA